MNYYKIILPLLMIVGYYNLQAQDRFYTKSGQISFFSKAPLESIEAGNKNVTCVLDTKTGQLQFLVLMRGFEFRKALMQEHFNENYVESSKFPKAEFKGQIIDNSEINYKQDGTYKANVKGKLSIHGETKEIESTATITIKDGKISASSGFNILLSDYKITIPAIVSDKVSNSVTITVNCMLELLKSS